MSVSDRVEITEPTEYGRIAYVSWDDVNRASVFAHGSTISIGQDTTLIKVPMNVALIIAQAITSHHNRLLDQAIYAPINHPAND